MRGNHSLFMNKTLPKAITLRTKMKNIFLKNRSEENKGNYRKERIICVQLLRKSKRDNSGSLDSLFSEYHGGFRKRFSSQHCLAAVLEKWKSAVENKKSFDALLADLSMTFYCIAHDLIGKLNTYGFNMKSLD